MQSKMITALLPDLPPTEAPLAPNSYTLNTERLLLRPPTKEDARGIWPFVTDPAITRFLAWEPHQDLQQTTAMLQSLHAAQQAGAGFHWVVCANNQLAGLISLIDVRRIHRSWTINAAELAYWIGQPYQGQGIATEASNCVLNFAFDRLNFNKISLYHATDNMASGAIPLKLGFRYVGEQREAFCKNGRWHSLKQFEMLRSDRNKRKGSQHEN